MLADGAADFALANNRAKRFRSEKWETAWKFLSLVICSWFSRYVRPIGALFLSHNPLVPERTQNYYINPFCPDH